MIWISFDMWNSKQGHFLSWHRIYRKGKRTPFCRVEKRYESWLGFWKKPDPITWLLVGHTITFAGVPSDEQMQEALNAVKPLGLVSTDQALASNGMFELYLENVPEEPDWKISIPDGHGRTASVTYKGKPIKVLSAHLDLQADAAAVLTLEVWSQHVEAVMDTLDIEIRTIPEGELHVDTIRKSQ